MKCRDCGFIDNTVHGLDKCPDCKSDDWVEIKRATPKKIARTLIGDWFMDCEEIKTMDQKDYDLLVARVADAIKAER